MEMLEVIVEPDGTATFVYSDDLAALFPDAQLRTRRASRVEPAAGGGWEADMAPVGGPVLGPFPTRGEALEAEVAWLLARMAEGPLEVR